MRPKSKPPFHNTHDQTWLIYVCNPVNTKSKYVTSVERLDWSRGIPSLGLGVCRNGSLLETKSKVKSNGHNIFAVGSG